MFQLFSENLPLRLTTQAMRARALLTFAALGFSLTSLAVVFCPTAGAQYRNLPRAGFGDSPSALPKVNGLHLTDGQERSSGPGPNAPGQPYNPGEPSLQMQLVRWEPKKMPLLIWISPGIKLPEVPFSEIQSTRVDMVTSMLHQPNPFAGCTQAPRWTPDTNDQVAAGIEQWREFEKEGLFSFMFTDDPRAAHILVFFVDNFKDSSAPGGISVGGNTCAQVYPYAQAQKIKIPQKPVVIELSTFVNSTPQKMQGSTAHEFGHALGIKAHSPYREDIMNVDRVFDYLSPSDKATIRYLYHKTPQWVM